MTRTVIIFGPTGGIGSAVVRSVHQRHPDTKVILAMRDPQKSIPGLSTEKEQSGGFERVQADLTDPNSIHDAVTKTGAKHAFIYTPFAPPDTVKASITALKSAGIESVVVLSSFSVQGDIRNIPASEIISFAHARMEITLEEVFGTDGGFVAIRPAYFASNVLWNKAEIQEGEVHLPYPDVEYDWISPEDVGSVCGEFLAGDVAKERYIYLVGPEKLSMRNAMGIIGKTIGKEVEVTQVDEEKALQVLVKGGVKDFIAKHLIEKIREAYQNPGIIFQSSAYQEGVGNIQRYTGRQPRRFHEWVEESKEKFGA